MQKEKLKNESDKVGEWLARELSNIRTGRATPALLDGVSIEQYGARTKISHVAAISIEDPKTLRVTPWDKATIKLIESAIQAANLGVSVSTDGVGVRVSFPDLTTERRTLLSKLVKEKLELARVSVRKEREECWNDVVKKEKDGEISEDDKFKLKEDLQKLVDEANTRLEEQAERKNKELAG